MHVKPWSSGCSKQLGIFSKSFSSSQHVQSFPELRCVLRVLCTHLLHPIVPCKKADLCRLTASVLNVNILCYKINSTCQVYKHMVYCCASLIDCGELDWTSYTCNKRITQNQYHIGMEIFFSLGLTIYCPECRDSM